MSAQIYQFPSPALIKTPTGLIPERRRSRDTQEQARRIVAQVEREIASQVANGTYDQRSQMSFHFSHPTPVVIEMETPATVARRIFNAILAFARSA